MPRTNGEVLGLAGRPDLVATAVNKTVYELSDRLGRRWSGPWQTNAIRRTSAVHILGACDPTSVAEVVDAVREPAGWSALHQSAQIALPLSDPRWAQM